jgi:Mn2+/Fe2+ NRAMP family transporter
MKISKKIALGISSVGPGIFLMGYNIGTGSVTTMAASGSRYGMSLFWALFLSCVFTFVMLIAYGRYSLVSGRTAISSYRELFGKGLAIFIVVGLIIGELAALMGIFGIVVNLLDEWIFYITASHINEVIVTAVIMLGLYYLFWTGGYLRFERILMVLVGIMGASFLSSMILVVPDFRQMAAGLVPSMPAEENAHLIAAGMAGTTLSAVVFVMRSIVVQEKGWDKTHLPIERRDAFVSAFLMLLLSAAVMACAAGTLYPAGIPVERAIDMVKTLEPMAGSFAISLFVIGIVSAGISTVFPIILIAPWLVSDYTNRPRDIKSPMYRILAGGALLLGLVIPIFGARPVFVMIASQAFQATLMPFVSLAILVLLNRRSLMGEYKAGFWLNLGCVATFIFSLGMAYSGIIGLSEML